MNVRRLQLRTSTSDVQRFSGKFRVFGFQHIVGTTYGCSVVEEWLCKPLCIECALLADSSDTYVAPLICLVGSVESSNHIPASRPNNHDVLRFRERILPYWHASKTLLSGSQSGQSKIGHGSGNSPLRDGRRSRFYDTAHLDCEKADCSNNVCALDRIFFHAVLHEAPVLGVHDRDSGQYRSHRSEGLDPGSNLGRLDRFSVESKH